jgi:murein DD-endopeptidase MepM/ murein hydrolase activator NlpD
MFKKQQIIIIIIAAIILIAVYYYYKKSKIKIVPGGKKSTGYGPRIHPITGLPDFHQAQDISAPSGTVIKSPASGVVSSVFTGANCGKGIKIKHKSKGIETGYCHLSRQILEKGQRVKKGQTIGLVGSTGRSTGPHLHFTVKNLKSGKYIDPLKANLIKI